MDLKELLKRVLKDFHKRVEEKLGKEIPESFWESLPEEVRFYRKTTKYYQFSNFFISPFEIDGKTYSTNEHFFQASKFIYPGSKELEYAEFIRNLKTPLEAFRAGKCRKHKFNSNWDKDKDDVMRRGVMAKFSSHLELKQLLLQTGNKKLIEDSPYDQYWGSSKTKPGKNMLGKILEETRETLSKSDFDAKFGKD